VIWEIINDGAQAYRGVIPQHCRKDRLASVRTHPANACHAAVLAIGSLISCMNTTNAPAQKVAR
jgi:hypothetical protein